MDGNPFLKIQRLGRALMLPIAVLPVAGLLLRLGPTRCVQHQDDRRRRRRDLRQPAAAVRDRRGGRLRERQQRRGGSRGCDRLSGRNRGDEGHQRQAQHGRVVRDRGGYRRGLAVQQVQGHQAARLPRVLRRETLRADCHRRGLSGARHRVRLRVAAGARRDRYGRPLADHRGCARRVRVRRAEPFAARHGSASHPQFADVVRVRHLHAAGRRAR